MVGNIPVIQSLQKLGILLYVPGTSCYAGCTWVWKNAIEDMAYLGTFEIWCDNDPLLIPIGFVGVI